MPSHPGRVIDLDEHVGAIRLWAQAWASGTITSSSQAAGRSPTNAATAVTSTSGGKGVAGTPSISTSSMGRAIGSSFTGLLFGAAGT